MSYELYEGPFVSDSLTHRGWEIRYVCLPRYRSGPEVVWSNWWASKDGRVLKGCEDQGGACPAYGDAIRAIDEIEIPRVAPYEGVL